MGTNLKEVMGFEFGLWGRKKKHVENIPIKRTYLIKDKFKYAWNAQEK